jgi:tripartite-type tricarboxylate transporter receptor subunit TctC
MTASSRIVPVARARLRAPVPATGSLVRAAAVLVLAALSVPVPAQAQAQAQAQAYPARPVRMVVPFPVGGGSDTTARILNVRLSDRLKQQVLVENRTGAGGTIGAEYVARSAPDGHVLLLGSPELVMLPAVAPRVSYDPLKDFAPIARVADVPLVLVVHPALPVANAVELIALARRRPGELAFGSAGSGTTSHLAMALFNALTGTRMLHVPYKGAVLALPDLLAGTLQAGMNTTPAAAPLVRSGRVRALAMTTLRRSPLLPDVPTLSESGVPGYEVALWTGVLAPAGTPAPTVRLLAREIETALQSGEVRDSLAKLGAEPNFMASDAFAGFLKSEYAKWIKLTRDADIRIDLQ